MRGLGLFIVGVGVGLALGVLVRRCEEEAEGRRVEELADDINRRLQGLELELSPGESNN